MSELMQGMKGETHTTRDFRTWGAVGFTTFGDYSDLDICPICGGEKRDPDAEMCGTCRGYARGVQADAEYQVRKLENHRAYKAALEGTVQ